MAGALTIRGMTSNDISLGMRLKEAAGWNQTEADWRRFLSLQPDGMWVAEINGVGVGTTATFVFDDVAWIAMVLVDAHFRSRGVATALMEHTLEWLGRQNVATVRLDATPQGRPLYDKLGFVPDYEVTRYGGKPKRMPPMIPATKLTGHHWLPNIAHLDKETTGTNRQRMLALLFTDPECAIQGICAGTELNGYVMIRPGSRAVQIGPCIAWDEITGTSLLNAAVTYTSGVMTFVDIPFPHRAANRWAASAGLSAQRTFTRMTKGARIRENVERLWASSGPEKG